MTPKTLTKEWKRAIDDPDITAAVDRAQGRWPRLSPAVLLLAALSTWDGFNRDQQTEEIGRLFGVDLDEAAADTAHAEGGDHA